ncbi:MAG TPA: VOC family protein [Dinghuibacter sp.]|uniref:VOC family protein n=1 Tax=Dinghuibacter sp. TaxID=2024697 RepID=UPI002BD39890|nr:VOC family protein [Dinghuibacter sp.]HTJ12326.1 VOC family protein [Dinghuibacter sp.]
MNHPVVHFEIGCQDLEKTTAFYTGLFGWSPLMAPPYAAHLQTGSADGIQGHITALGHEPHQYVTFYIRTDDIADTLRRIEAAGGKKLLGPVPLPDKSHFAWFRDPEGNTIGLVTPAP